MLVFGAAEKVYFKLKIMFFRSETRGRFPEIIRRQGNFSMAPPSFPPGQTLPSGPGGLILKKDHYPEATFFTAKKYRATRGCFHESPMPGGGN
jgi:hypothetical protein